MHSNDHINDGGRILAVGSSRRGRISFRWRGGQQRRSTKKDFSEVTCHYCEEEGHIQSQCAMLREDLKSLKQFKGKVQVAESSDDGDLYHVESDDNDYVKNHSRWVLDSTANVHVCKDKPCLLLCRKMEILVVSM